MSARILRDSAATSEATSCRIDVDVYLRDGVKRGVCISATEGFAVAGAIFEDRASIDYIIETLERAAGEVWGPR